MRPIRYLALIGIFLLPIHAFADDLGIIRLSLIEGDVQVMIQGSTDWTDAAINVPLNEGDRLWIPDNGRAELEIRGGDYVRVNGNTALDILTITADSAQFYLDRGHIYINNRRGGIKTVQVDTPLSSVRGFDNSIMMFDVSVDNVTEVSMLKGYAYAETRGGSTRVSAGSALSMRDQNSADLAPIGAPDEWEQWNLDRDKQLTAWGESSRYLPDELHEYSSDFDRNGRWIYMTDHGYVWTPVVIEVEWAPYTNGRWVWIHGHYVWIAYDHWGWAPHHYGRWFHVIGTGWCWAPPRPGAVYWGPGFVGWVVTPQYAAWVPLAPGEIYYGRGYYGPASVNITTINVNIVTMNRPYMNAGVKNAVTTVHRDSFGTGRRIPVKIDKNPFVKMARNNIGEANIAPPHAKPQGSIILVPSEIREHVRQLPPERKKPEIPVIHREVHTTSPAMITERPSITPPSSRQPQVQVLPPERVRKTRPDEMKNERRLVRDREASVFRERQGNLKVKQMKEPKMVVRKGHPADHREKKEKQQ